MLASLISQIISHYHVGMYVYKAVHLKLILNFYYDSRVQIFDTSHCQVGDFIASEAVILSDK
jgi:hypothetical protein